MDLTECSPALWRPSAVLDTLRLRAELLANIRSFFAQHHVLEVETPILGRASVTDPHVESLRLSGSPTGADEDTWYLQTSPEFAMKRMLAAGSGDIFQIARVFRRGEFGYLHNPEFTMLEWYRLGFDHHRLMDEVENLLKKLYAISACERMSYAAAFERHVGLNPHQASISELAHCACDFAVEQDLVLSLTERDQWLDLLMSRVVGPKLGLNGLTFIYDFPASQAALARIGPSGLAERFELFSAGVEIANGYHELLDDVELLERFDRDNSTRQRLGIESVTIDHKLLAAMQSGLPKCAGVAIGLDRLLMLSTKGSSIASVMGFTCATI